MTNLLKSDNPQVISKIKLLHNKTTQYYGNIGRHYSKVVFIRTMVLVDCVLQMAES